MVEGLPWASVVILRSWEWVLHQAHCREPASLSTCVSAPLSLSLSVCLSWINKKILKKKKDLFLPALKCCLLMVHIPHDTCMHTCVQLHLYAHMYAHLLGGMQPLPPASLPCCPNLNQTPLTVSVSSLTPLSLLSPTSESTSMVCHYCLSSWVPWLQSWPYHYQWLHHLWESLTLSIPSNDFLSYWCTHASAQTSAVLWPH